MLLRSVRAIALLGSAEIALRGPRRAPSCRNFCNDTPVRASKPAKIRAPRDAAGTRRTVRRPKRWFAAAASRAPEVAPPRGSERSIFMLFRSVRAIALLRLAHNLGGGGRMRFFPDSPRNLEKSWESIIFRRFSIRLHRFSLKNNEKLSFSILGRSIFALFRSARALALPWCASPRGPERSLSSKGQRNRSLQRSKRPSLGEGGWVGEQVPPLLATVPRIRTARAKFTDFPIFCQTPVQIQRPDENAYFKRAKVVQGTPAPSAQPRAVVA